MNNSGATLVHLLEMNNLRLARTSLRFVLLLVVVLLPLRVVDARGQTRQATPDDALFRTLVSLDKAVFDAYNTCDLETFGSFFTEDAEFYHDKGGVTLGRKAIVESVKNNICGRTRRDPVAGTLEVHPMDGFGALQIGSHRFCDVKSTVCDGTSGGVGKFIHLWRHKDGVWTITRVYSYDHAPAVK